MYMYVYNKILIHVASVLAVAIAFVGLWTLIPTFREGGSLYVGLCRNLS